MAWNTSNIPNLTGQVAVVTGANSGLGLESAKALAAAGAHVVMAARNQEKATSARDQILAAHPEASLEIVELDLGSLESTHAAAATIAANHPKVDILMNNAGLMAMPERKTADGFEMQFGVNHLGHWVFTADLLGSLLSADAARVVTVSSTAHHFGRAVDPDNVNMEGNYSAWGAYGRAKLANFHFGIGLQREFEKSRVAAMSLNAHPGLSHTNLQVHTHEQGGAGWSSGLWKSLAARTGMSSARGALSQLRAATDPNAEGGEFYGPRWGNNGPPVRKPTMRPGIDSAIEKLWLVSERETGVKLDVAAAKEKA